jgi:hypothetical protein
LPAGLVAYYPFNGNANDESGNGNHGSVYGATLTEDRFGVPDSAYSFDGQNNFIQIENINDFKLTSWTIAGWIRKSSSKFSTIVSKPEDSSFKYNYAVHFGSSTVYSQYEDMLF